MKNKSWQLQERQAGSEEALSGLCMQTLLTAWSSRGAVLSAVPLRILPVDKIDVRACT